MVKASDIVEKCRYALEVKGGYIWGQTGQTWTRKLQDKLVARLVSLFGNDWQNSKAAKDDNYYMGGKYGSKWIDHRVWDCSGLVRWAMKQYGIEIAHGSNSIYDRYCAHKGTLKNGKRTDGEPLKPGSPVFTSDSNGKKPHIGIYEGDGNVIEAASTQKGVVRSKITDKNSKGKDKWTHWGELKDVQYDGSDETPVESPVKEDDDMGYPTLRKGDKGEAVKELQTLLMQRGYDLGKWGADGDFGKQTQTAVKQFQTDWGLKVDGVVGNDTWKMLLSTPEKPKYYTVTITHLSKEKADEIVNKYGGSAVEE